MAALNDIDDFDSTSNSVQKKLLIVSLGFTYQKAELRTFQES